MVRRYVPILRPKRGERTGLQQLSQQARQDVLPFFMLVHDQFVGKAATKNTPAVTPPNHLVQQIESSWGTAPFYLDASALAQSTGQHPLLLIANRARARHLNLIPATWMGAPAQYQQAVSNVVQTDHRGVALRVGLQGMTSVATWINGWVHALSDTDLIVDIGGNVSVVQALGTALNNAFFNLHQGASWRTVTLAGTSMPDNFQGYFAGAHHIPRVEWGLWQALSAAHLPYRLDYGDYATVPINPPPVGIRWGFPINVRYTLATDFFVCRGVPTTGLGAVDMDQQLIGHAQTIATYPKRGRLSCWPDDEIDAIAGQSSGPGNLEHWVQIGVSRHVELVRSQLP